MCSATGCCGRRTYKLVAAFDHRHIFIDPDPDPAASFAERQRLFAAATQQLGRLRDIAALRPAAACTRASLKTIELSDAARRRLGTEARACTPADLVSIILRAPVDVLWNGGIGTYVKATTETHAEVGDRANDSAAGERC
jgi:glutamate dehydrogenase